MSSNQALLITGMHRSGTSLVASILGCAGVNLGEKLLGPNRGNPRGHFEDLRFLELHEELLASFGYGMLPKTLRRPLIPPPEFEKKARQLVTNTRGLWGFKDPRTCLFLDFWHEVLPEARFVFLFRHPLDVLISFLHRASDLQVLLQPFCAIDSWQVYNEEILRFKKLHPERCYLAEIYSAAENFPRFIDTLASKLKLPLNSDQAAKPFAPTELHQTVASEEVAESFQHLAPRADALYRQLVETADSARAVSPPPPWVEPSDAKPPETTEAELLMLLSRIAPTAISSRRDALLEHLDQWDQLHHTAAEGKRQVERLTAQMDELATQLEQERDHQRQREERLRQQEELMRRLALHIEALEDLVAEQTALLG